MAFDHRALRDLARLTYLHGRYQSVLAPGIIEHRVAPIMLHLPLFDELEYHGHFWVEHGSSVFSRGQLPLRVVVQHEGDVRGQDPQVLLLEPLCQSYDALDCSQAEVVRRRGENCLLSEGEDRSNLLGKLLSLIETCAIEEDLSDVGEVRDHHGNLPEQAPQVVGNVMSASIFRV